MKVLLLAENYYPRRGGIENYLGAIAKNLGEGEVDVTVVAPRTTPSLTTAKPPLLRKEGKTMVKRYWFFTSLIRPKWLFLFIRIWRMAKRDPWDVTMCGKALFEGLVGYYLKKHLGIPYIVFTYAMEIDEWSSNSREKRKLVRVLSEADRVVYINDKTKKSLVELGVKEDQLVKIWPGVNERYFEPSLQPSPWKGRGLDKKSYVLCVARLVERKGIDLLISAFSKIDKTKFGEVELWIAGEGPERNKLEKLAEREMVKTSVKFLGFVEDDKLPNLYAGAKVFALTSTEAEGFGIVYVEAAVAGTPAIATDIGGASEAVLDNETGLVVKPNVDDIKNALEKILSDDILRERLGEAARARAEEQFKWDKRIMLVKGMLDAVVDTR